MRANDPLNMCEFTLPFMQKAGEGNQYVPVSGLDYAYISPYADFQWAVAGCLYPVLWCYCFLPLNM